MDDEAHVDESIRRTWGICNNNVIIRGERANFTRLVLGCIEASKQASKVEQSLS